MAQNPYGGKSSGVPVQVTKDKIKDDPRRCYRRKLWVDEEGEGWDVVLQDNRPCCCTWAYSTKYSFQQKEKEVGKMEEIASCMSKFICPI